MPRHESRMAAFLLEALENCSAFESLSQSVSQHLHIDSIQDGCDARRAQWL